MFREMVPILKYLCGLQVLVLNFFCTQNWFGFKTVCTICSFSVVAACTIKTIENVKLFWCELQMIFFINFNIFISIVSLCTCINVFYFSILKYTCLLLSCLNHIIVGVCEASYFLETIKKETMIWLQDYSPQMLKMLF